MDKLFDKFIAFMALIFKALIKAYVYFFLMKIALNFLAIPIKVFLPAEIMNKFMELYGEYGLRALFGIEIVSILLGNSKNKITYKNIKRRKEVSNTGLKKNFYGRSKKLDKKLDSVLKLNKLYKIYILEKLDSSELLYSKSENLLSKINQSFNVDIENCLKYIDLIDIYGKNAKESKGSLELLNSCYEEMDKKSQNIMNVIQNFDIDKKKTRENNEYLNKDFEKLLDLINKI